jgi:hypothetical protein
MENSNNDETKKFVAEKTAEVAAKYPNKPIFLFSHIPQQDTCYGSHSWGSTSFLSTLEKYPQAVFFSGHTHTPIGDPRMIHQGKFTSINDGSNQYCCVEKNEVEDGVGLRCGSNVTEGFIVNVLPGSKFEVERWDTFHDEEILPRWTVDWKNYNFLNRTGTPAPAFAKGIKPTVKVNGKGCDVTFPQAKDNEAVFRYFVEIQEDGKTLATVKKFSQFCLNSAMPETLTATFKTVPKGKKLTAAVKALDSFNNTSEVIVSEEFTV